MDTAAFTTTLTCVGGGHILDPVLGSPNPWLYTLVYSEVTSLENNVASSTGFFFFSFALLHLLVAVLLYEPCTATPANQPIW